MRELSYKALLYMEGQDVNVIDLEYDCYIQKCEVKLKRQWILNNKLKPVLYTVGIILENEEYKFEYDFNGKCLDGDFLVFSLQHKKEDWKIYYEQLYDLVRKRCLQ